QFLAAQPELSPGTDGRVRLAIRSGVLALGSLAHTAGLAVGVTPDWDAMQPMRLPDRASAEMPEACMRSRSPPVHRAVVRPLVDDASIGEPAHPVLAPGASAN